VLIRKTWWFKIGNLECVNSGILDREAECGQESLFGWSSTRNQLFPWKQLFGGNIIYACMPYIQLRYSGSQHFEMQPFQLGVDIGSSTVARGVVSLVLGYLNNLVIEMAFLVQVMAVG
jgi:hypothetical protein